MADLPWIKDTLVSLKLRDDLFSVAQFMDSPVLCCFRKSRQQPQWEGLELSREDVLFQVFVGSVVLEKLVHAVIPPSVAKPVPGLETQRRWIKPKLHFGGSYPFKGGDLVEVDFVNKIGSASAPVIKANLQPSDPLVGEHEFSSVWGADHLRDRLSHVFDTGADLDPLKAKIFP
ncbi:hypothetical protein VQH23_01685 [Pararoseomonas sp. SCSIO 73927]|uniref:hypothetical protein n=1 Tax=Pararoseomonas sp. SCSIO 73927 TaxID=3114537 RepID=UPI0030D15FA2